MFSETRYEFFKIIRNTWITLVTLSAFCFREKAIELLSFRGFLPLKET